VRHPELSGAAVIPSEALASHQANDWVVCSPPFEDKYAIDPDRFPDPLPAGEPEPQPDLPRFVPDDSPPSADLSSDVDEEEPSAVADPPAIEEEK
jgi:hypothetical protein